MGTFHSNLDKISHKCSATAKGVVGATLLALCFALVLGNVENVDAKSLTSSPSTGTTDNDNASESTFVTTTFMPPTTVNSSSIKTVELDARKLPQDSWVLKEDGVPLEPTKFIISAQSKDLFLMAIHLKECDFENDEEYIEIKWKTDEEENNEIWDCAAKTSDIPSDDLVEYEYTYQPQSIHTSSSDKHAGDKYVHVQKVMDKVKEVTISHKYTKGHHHMKNRKRSKKATIIVNLYRDIAGKDKCPDEMFDCHQEVCPTTCCSKVSSESRSSGRQEKSATATSESFIFSSTFWSKRSSEKSRCIPNALKCNSNPNCGMKKNIDESNEICHEEKYCPCQSICLTWNYVLTSLAIAVLFIITPTAIVFALFHRRNVALERARLIRLAHMRMAETRGTDYTHDVPPTYDEVYDTKEPPPCFCKAIAMQKELDLQEQRESAAEETATDARVVQIDGEESGAVEFQNLGFQCSCLNVRSKSEEDIPPPSYGDANMEGNEANDGKDATGEQQRRNVEASSNSAQVDSTEFENVDLEKED